MSLSLVCRPLTSDPTYFGGSTEKPAFVMKDLCRLKQLPARKRFSTPDKDAQIAYEQLYAGYFDCKVREPRPGELFVFCQNNHPDCPDKFRGETLIQTEVLLPKSPRFLPEYRDADIASHVGHQKIPMFDNSLNADDKQRLADRSLHHLIRQHGAQIKPDFIKGISAYLYYQLATVHKRYGEAADMLSATLDCMASHGFSSNDLGVALSMTKLAETLEAKEEFVWAAKIYDLSMPGYENVAHEHFLMLGHAALAYKRAGNLELAEERYVKAVQIMHKQFHRGKLDFSYNEHVFSVLGNMLNMYNALFKTMPEAGGILSVTLPHKKALHLILGPILHLSGLQVPLDKRAEQDSLQGHVCDAFAAYSKYLKQKFATPKAARKIWLQAVQTTSLAGFRKVLMDCMKVQTIKMKVPPPLSSQDKTAIDKVAARSMIHDNHSRDESLVTIRCDACGKPGAKLNCPCKSVVYCSKECQVAHWKEHKASSPFHQKKQS